MLEKREGMMRWDKFIMALLGKKCRRMGSRTLVVEGIAREDKSAL